MVQSYDTDSGIAQCVLRTLIRLTFFHLFVVALVSADALMQLGRKTKEKYPICPANLVLIYNFIQEALGKVDEELSADWTLLAYFL